MNLIDVLMYSKKWVKLVPSAMSYHYPASDILDGPEVEGEQEGDGHENPNEGRREVSAENVDKKRSHPKDL